MPVASARIEAAEALPERDGVELLLDALPEPRHGAWDGEPARPVPLFRQVPEALQRRRSDDWLAWNVGRVRPDPFAILFERHWGPISAFCLSIVGTREEAEDAAQETMARAYATLSRRQERPDFRPWLHAIARNAALDRIRQRNRGPQLSFDGQEPEVGVADDPDEVLGRRERLERLVADLQSLSERQRAAIVMRELSGMSHDEIARALGTTPDRSRSLVSEARQALGERGAGRRVRCGEYRRAVAAAGGRPPRGQRLALHRESCASCRAFARPRILAGFLPLPLPLADLFASAGRRIAAVRRPVAAHFAGSGAVKAATAASVAALALPAVQHVADGGDPVPVREGRAAAASTSSGGGDAAPAAVAERGDTRTDRREAGGREGAGAGAAHADRPGGDAGGRGADGRTRAGRAGLAAGAAELTGALRDEVARLGERLDATRRDVERLVAEDAPAALRDTQKSLRAPIPTADGHDGHDAAQGKGTGPAGGTGAKAPAGARGDEVRLPVLPGTGALAPRGGSPTG